MSLAGASVTDPACTSLESATSRLSVVSEIHDESAAHRHEYSQRNRHGISGSSDHRPKLYYFRGVSPLLGLTETDKTTVGA
jgi:hypothetical protein